MILLKSPREIAIMKNAGQITGRILNELADFVKPGISTLDIDNLAERLCKENKVVPAFKGYHGFPASVCVSINHEVVHGIPSKKKILKDGDIIGLDFGVIYEGYYGDSAKTVAVGDVDPKVAHLIEVTKKSLFKGIAAAKKENRLFDISYAIQSFAESEGFSIVREFVGHGIGRSLHEDPQVPNYGPKGKGAQLRVGMVIAIEPMINIGGNAVRIEDDGWTAVTSDGSMSAHFEHTVAITEDGPEILTLVE